MKRWQRVALGLGAPLGILGILAGLRAGLIAPPCMFRRLTGLYCAGCGSTRAIRALLRGQWRAAFGYNPLFLLMGLPCILILLYEYLRLVFPRLALRPVRLPQPVVLGALFTLIAFWILRNIPAFSFLAPG